MPRAGLSSIAIALTLAVALGQSLLAQAQPETPAAQQAQASRTVLVPAPRGDLEVSLPPSFTDIHLLKEQREFSARHPAGLCLGGISDIPPDKVQAVPLPQLVDTALNNMLTNREAMLESQVPLEREGLPGRRAVFSTQENGQTFFTQVDFLINGAYVYALMFSSPTRATLDQPEIRQLFQSFSIRKVR